MTREEAEQRARALGHEPYGWYAVGTGCWVYFCRYDGPWHELHDCYEGRLYYRDAVDGEPCPVPDREDARPTVAGNVTVRAASGARRDVPGVGGGDYDRET